VSQVSSQHRNHNCPAALALDAVGDRWSPQILQEALFYGTTIFSDFKKSLDIDPNILATRMLKFVDSGLMLVQGSPEDESHDEVEFVLTQKGRELAPAMIALANWADHWTAQVAPHAIFEHEGCGGTLRQLISCDICGETASLERVRTRIDEDTERATVLSALRTDGAFDGNPTPSKIEITLLDTFSVHIDGDAANGLSIGTQRVLAYLALHDHAVSRLSMAGTMWPEVSDHSAGGCLRSALSRLDGPTRGAIQMASAGLRLGEYVTVDFRESKALAHRLLQPDVLPDESDICPSAVAALSTDLLVDWYDEWVVTEAEDWQQLRLNALEAQACFLTRSGRWAEAAGAARAAMRAEPLCESAYASLIRVHLAEGNQSAALRVFDRFRELLLSELELEPTPLLTDLVAGIMKGHRRAHKGTLVA
jgi:DNA-binding SARP family transcriptional activator/DNA-binding HxlR family transcriptional regulator